jgi:hypothetical protein
VKEALVCQFQNPFPFFHLLSHVFPNSVGLCLEVYCAILQEKGQAGWGNVTASVWGVPVD